MMFKHATPTHYSARLVSLILIAITALICLAAAAMPALKPTQAFADDVTYYRLVSAQNPAVAVQLSSATNGTGVAMAAVSDAKTQFFSMRENSDGTVTFVSAANDGIALTAKSLAWRAAVTANTLGSGGYQSWKLEKLSDGSYHVWIPGWVWMLDVNGSYVKAGGGAILWQDNKGATQKWILQEVKVGTSGSSSSSDSSSGSSSSGSSSSSGQQASQSSTTVYYRLVSAQNTSVAVQVSATSNGSGVAMAAKSDAKTQLFVMRENSDGTVSFLSAANETLALTAKSLAWRAAVTANTLGSGGYQSWKLEKLSDGSYHVWIPGWVWMLDVNGSYVKAGGGAILWQDNKGATQKWILEKVEVQNQSGSSSGSSSGSGSGSSSGSGSTTPSEPAPTTLSDAEYWAQFTPVVRFTVGSDVHVADSGTSLEEQRLAKMITGSYGYAGSQSGYKALDALVIVGDLTDAGTAASFNKVNSIVNANIRSGTQRLFVLGNHDYYNVTSAESRFSSIFGLDPDFHVVINGFHLIGISPSSNGNGYTSADTSWLAEQLAIAAADTPNKPIFVFQHHHAGNTVYGSSFWYTNDVTSVLSRYPQVIDFSGHSHYPIENPRSVWQGSFTALGTGTLSYFEMGLSGVSDALIFPVGNDGAYQTTPSGTKDGAEYYIVEADKYGAVCIKGFDITSGTQICCYLFRTPWDKSTFTYGTSRANWMPVPEWGSGAALSVAVSGSTATVTVPAATCSKGIVESYRAELYKGGSKVDTKYLLGCYQIHPTPSTLPVQFTGLEAGASYEVRVYAVNAWGKDSAGYLSMQFDCSTGAVLGAKGVLGVIPEDLEGMALEADDSSVAPETGDSSVPAPDGGNDAPVTEPGAEVADPANQPATSDANDSQGADGSPEPSGQPAASDADTPQGSDGSSEVATGNPEGGADGTSGTPVDEGAQVVADPTASGEGNDTVTNDSPDQPSDEAPAPAPVSEEDSAGAPATEPESTPDAVAFPEAA